MSIAATAFNGNELFVRVCISVKVADISVHLVCFTKWASQNFVIDRNSVCII